MPDALFLHNCILDHFDRCRENFIITAMKCPECGSDCSESKVNCPSCGCLLATGEDEPTISDVILPSFKCGAKVAGRYEIISEVGKGGFGRVFRAHDAQSGKVVALKLLKPDLTSDERARSRFLGELKMSRRIVHPNVISLSDILEVGGLCVLVMEFVEGQSLKLMIRNEAPFSIELAYKIISQVCLGLDAAHRVGVIHRDIKPQNILITDDLGVKIADFGLARHLGGSTVTQTGMILGTPEYMSPEQIGGRAVDGRSDIYSLGVVMYEMFTGKLPFTGETPVAVILAHVRRPPESPKRMCPDMPVWVNYMILKAMAKKPSKRFGKATEILEYFQQNMVKPKSAKEEAGKPKAEVRGERPEAESGGPAAKEAATPPLVRARKRRRPELLVLAAVLIGFMMLSAFVAVVAVRTHFESPEKIQAIINAAKEKEDKLDYHGAYLTYLKGTKEVPGSVVLYARAGLAFVQHVSKAHPGPLMLSLLAFLFLLFVPLFLIQRKLRR